jgi:hypothetical protein
MAEDRPRFLRLPPEVMTKIFSLVLVNKEAHEICNFPTFSPRSGQILRVCKDFHDKAAPILYGETEFAYIGMAHSDTTYLPVMANRTHIRNLTLESPDFMLLHLDEYTSLRSLTFEVPRFLRLQAGVDACRRIRHSPALRAILDRTESLPQLEITVEGEMSEMANGTWCTIRRKVTVRKAG